MIGGKRGGDNSAGVCCEKSCKDNLIESILCARVCVCVRVCEIQPWTIGKSLCDYIHIFDLKISTDLNNNHIWLFLICLYVKVTHENWVPNE